MATSCATISHKEKAFKVAVVKLVQQRMQNLISESMWLTEDDFALYAQLANEQERCNFGWKFLIAFVKTTIIGVAFSMTFVEFDRIFQY